MTIWLLPSRNNGTCTSSHSHFSEPVRHKWTSAIFQFDLIFYTAEDVGHFYLKYKKKIFINGIIWSLGGILKWNIKEMMQIK